MRRIGRSAVSLRLDAKTAPLVRLVLGRSPRVARLMKHSAIGWGQPEIRPLANRLDMIDLETRIRRVDN